MTQLTKNSITIHVLLRVAVSLPSGVREFRVDSTITILNVSPEKPFYEIVFFFRSPSDTTLRTDEVFVNSLISFMLTFQHF